MRHVPSRAQWEHTDEEEQLNGWSLTANKDMPPSLVKLLDDRETRLVKVADKLQASRARLAEAEELLRDGDFGNAWQCTNWPGKSCYSMAGKCWRHRVRAFLAAQPVPGEPK